MLYNISRLPKGNGKFREIYVPSSEYKNRLRGFIPELEETLKRLDKHKVNYAFQKGRNCALNALQHIGFRHTLSMDLEDFFNHIKVSHVLGLVRTEVIDHCFIDGNPKQGLPTSPLISSIAFLRCDTEVVCSLQKILPKFAYTRYADDLIISFDEFADLKKISFIVRQIAERHGFRINSAKTRVQDRKNGHVIITGIAIGDNGLVATRRTKRKIRAAAHQKNKQSEEGLLEWSRCKLPNEFFK